MALVAGGVLRRDAGDAREDLPAAGVAAQVQCAGHHGKTVQLDPVRPTLKAPVTEHLTLESDKLLSNFGFKINLRRYTTYEFVMRDRAKLSKVGRCRLTLSNPC
jgi:hypothetical protein